MAPANVLSANPLEHRMTHEPWLELPEHVVAKIEKVLGIPPSEQAAHGLVALIEDLCDTALMFDREEVGAAEPDGAEEHPQRLPQLPPRPNGSL
jgi:hypothetical protein